MAISQNYGTGRRKTATARVYMTPGTGNITVNGRALDEFFGRVTGRKLSDKIYYHHTGAIGGIKSIALDKLLKEHPERAIEFAVKGMLPKNPLGRRMYKKLHVFAGGQHPHSAQQPKPLEIQEA